MRRYADPGVADAEFDVRVHPLQQHLDLAALGRELDRVAQEVPEHLLQAAGSPETVPARGIQHAFQAHALCLRGRLGGFDRPSDDIRERHLLHVEPDAPGHDAAQVEQVVDQLHLRARVAFDDLHAAAEARRASALPCLRSICVQPRMAFNGVRSSCDSVARNSSLMRAARCAAMRALRSASSISRAARRSASRASARLRSVRSRVSLANPRRRCRSIAQGRDGDVGPEPRAVLAHAPAFVDEAALLGGRLQLVLGPAARRRPPAG